MWQQLKLTAPASATALAASLSSAMSGLGEALGAGLSGLADMDLDIDFNIEDLLPGREDLSGLFSGECSFIAFTPLDSGSRKGNYAYMTPQEALEAVQARLVELSNDEAVLLLLCPAESSGDLSRSLAPLLSAYPIPVLEKVARRAAALATLETDKMNIPLSIPLYPPSQPDSPALHPFGRNSSRALANMATLAEVSNRAGADPMNRLKDFASERLASASSMLESFKNMQESLTASVPFFVSYFETPEEKLLLSKLVEYAPVPEIYKESSVFCWHGLPGNLKFMRELFGL